MLFAFEADPEVTRRVISGIVIFFGTSVLSFVAGRWWGKYQARRQWRNKQFLGRIIVSLNSLTDGWLKIRTIFERSLEEVFLNSVAIEKVRSASLRATLDNPLLPIDKEDRWYLLNFVLNAVAERFSNGLMRYDAGQPLKPITYLLFLTCEVVGEDRIRKVRAMMLRKDLLEDFPYWDAMPKLEQAWHGDRIVTLRRAAELYKKEPDNFLPIEIYI
ncbi:MAG TPA: hypothetical protein VN688_15990 [Gemmataceae bacterium]|nr:hypothetical protein [Gemmataceae bacterium]